MRIRLELKMKQYKEMVKETAASSSADSVAETDKVPYAIVI